MAKQRNAPYGSWKSPLTSEMIVSESIKLGQLQIDKSDLYWIESRPTEGGRNVIVRRTPDDTTQTITPSPFNIRSRVHEYGGGAYLVVDGVTYFSNFSDQRIYKQDIGSSEPSPMTNDDLYRYADYVIDQNHNRLIGIREDHTNSELEPTNTITSISLQSPFTKTSENVLVSGDDFYSSPRLSPDGQSLAWLAWNHPNMPWDGTELWVASIQSDGSLLHPTCVAGGREESIYQPEWSPTNVLHFVSDRTGWWNLYRINDDDESEALCPMKAEFGMPQWVFGLSTYAFSWRNSIICTYTQKGVWYIGSLNTSTKQLEPFALPYTEFENVRVSNNHIYCITSSPTAPRSLVQIDIDSQQVEIIRSSTSTSTSQFNNKYLSVPECIEYRTDFGQTAHAFFYKPKNDDYSAPPSEKPPLIVKSHGGPTGSCGQAFNLKIQYWTSRGFAVLDVNYRGSTGFGRAYREQLNGQWGIADVMDCVNGAKHLIDNQTVDSSRVAIMGGSAGGYTTLCALTFHDIFTGGSSYYGISDLEALAQDTHKFESRYLDRLIGPYPKQQHLYKARSPIHFTEQLSCPMILFQGMEDKVVPPNQAERMVEAIKSKGLPVAYFLFPDEQHGFRKAENMRRVLDAELYFYGRIFQFLPADSIEPVLISNLAH